MRRRRRPLPHPPARGSGTRTPIGAGLRPPGLGGKLAGRAAAGAAVGAAAGRDAGEAVDGASSGVGAEANLDSRCVGDPRLGPPVAVC